MRELTYEEAKRTEDMLILTGWEDGVCINEVRSGLIKVEGKEKEYNKQYSKEHKSQEYEKSKRWREKNRDLINERARIRRRNNVEKLREINKEYYEKNKEKENERCRIYKLNHSDDIREYNRRYREKKKFEKLGYLPLF